MNSLSLYSGNVRKQPTSTVDRYNLRVNLTLLDKPVSSGFIVKVFEKATGMLQGIYETDSQSSIYVSYLQKHLEYIIIGFDKNKEYASVLYDINFLGDKTPQFNLLDTETFVKQYPREAFKLSTTSPEFYEEEAPQDLVAAFSNPYSPVDDLGLAYNFSVAPSIFESVRDGRAVLYLSNLNEENYILTTPVYALKLSSFTFETTFYVSSYKTSSSLFVMTGGYTLETPSRDRLVLKKNSQIIKEFNFQWESSFTVTISYDQLCFYLFLDGRLVYQSETNIEPINTLLFFKSLSIYLYNYRLYSTCKYVTSYTVDKSFKQFTPSRKDKVFDLFVKDGFFKSNTKPLAVNTQAATNNFFTTPRYKDFGLKNNFILDLCVKVNSESTGVIKGVESSTYNWNIGGDNFLALRAQTDVVVASKTSSLDIVRVSFVRKDNKVEAYRNSKYVSTTTLSSNFIYNNYGSLNIDVQNSQLLFFNMYNESPVTIEDVLEELSEKDLENSNYALLPFTFQNVFFNDYTNPKFPYFNNKGVAVSNEESYYKRQSLEFSKDSELTSVEPYFYVEDEDFYLVLKFKPVDIVVRQLVFYLENIDSSFIFEILVENKRVWLKSGESVQELDLMREGYFNELCLQQKNGIFEAYLNGSRFEVTIPTPLYDFFFMNAGSNTFEGYFNDIFYSKLVPRYKTDEYVPLFIDLSYKDFKVYMKKDGNAPPTNNFTIYI